MTEYLTRSGLLPSLEALGFGVAYSHQAFEFWLILHFEEHQGGEMPRDLYYDKINSHLQKINSNVVYDKKSKKITDGIFNILQGIDRKTGETRQNLAIKRAKKIYASKNEQATESSTTVFKLVEKLMGLEP